MVGRHRHDDKYMTKRPARPDEQGAEHRLTRGEALDDEGYRLLLELMAVLARRYGDDAVRLVAWFD